MPWSQGCASRGCVRHPSDRRCGAMGTGASAEAVGPKADAWLQEANDEALRDTARAAALKKLHGLATAPRSSRPLQTHLTGPDLGGERNRTDRTDRNAPLFSVAIFVIKWFQNLHKNWALYIQK
jgi:hypothetical protein